MRTIIEIYDTRAQSYFVCIFQDILFCFFYMLQKLIAQNICKQRTEEVWKNINTFRFDNISI